MSEKEMPQFPIRTDVTICQADAPKDHLIGWTMKEYLGFTVYKATDEMLANHSLRKLLDDRLWPEDSDGQPRLHKPLTKYEDLQVGDKIIVKSLYDYLWFIAEVEERSDGSLRAATESCLVMLQFSEDDRKCWVASGTVNKACLDKVTFDV